MTRNISLQRSLYSKMIYTLLAGSLCALLVFSIISGIGTLVVNNIYMSPQSVAARKADIYARFSSYVSANEIKGTDSANIAKWTEQNEYITILVYGMSVESHIIGEDPLVSSSGEHVVEYTGMPAYSTEFGKLYPLHFADAKYQIAIGDSTQAREHMLYDFAAAIVAVITFFGMLLMYISKLTTRIVLLSRNAAEIGAGDFNKPIRATGDDELAMLAVEMDNMRCSVIERMQNEQRAWEANSELITAISHDIRTPMTTMIGYLGLLNEGKFEDDAHGKQYVAAAYSKAIELKDLTDELFKYFLVLGKAKLDLEMEVFDARLLLGQLLGEAEFALLEAGFDVHRQLLADDCFISTDPLYLKRVVDNLLSNVRKYSAKDQPVYIVAQLIDEKLHVCFSNTVSSFMDGVESTKIGIRTCVMIMEHMGGEFVSNNDGEHFSAQFILPSCEQ